MPVKANESEIEARARLLFQAQEDQARALARDMANEPLLDGVDPSEQEIVEAWNYSPVAEPESSFWALVDYAVTQGGIARDMAEEIALRNVYPHRPTLIGLGVFPLEIQVRRAERIARMVERAAATPPKSEPAQPTEAY